MVRVSGCWKWFGSRNGRDMVVVWYKLTEWTGSMKVECICGRVGGSGLS